MRLVILGSSGTYPRPGGACNGFLIQEGETNLILDLGNGCLSNFLLEADLTSLDVVAVSHMHIDHFGDLYPLYYGLRFHPDKPWGMRLLIPERGLDIMGRLLSEDARAYLTRIYEAETVAAGREYTVGDMKLTFHPTRHPVESYGIRVEGEDWVLAYSSDTSPCAGLDEAARGADVFICEATMSPENADKAEEYGHMTAAQAGEAAERAGVGLLMLTHVWPTRDPADAVREAGKAYSGRVLYEPEGWSMHWGGDSDAQE
ncbi:MAG: MBL fold metallo-hydrolase [Actinomycetota bacterium]|nr:MBL fold metallo-hydrolase [Actinomycetota bacterium]